MVTAPVLLLGAVSTAPSLLPHPCQAQLTRAFHPALLLPPPPCWAGTANFSTGQFPKPSVLAPMSQPCPVLPLIHSAVAVPSLFPDGSPRSCSLQGQGHPALCSATQGRGWLLVDVAQTYSCPRHRDSHLLGAAKGRGSRGRAEVI